MPKTTICNMGCKKYIAGLQVLIGLVKNAMYYLLRQERMNNLKEQKG